MVRKLLENGADACVANDKGQTAGILAGPNVCSLGMLRDAAPPAPAPAAQDADASRMGQGRWAAAADQ